MSRALPLARARAGSAGLRSLISLVVGALACSTAVTSVLALGWLQGNMRALALRRVGHGVAGPGWVFGTPDGGRAERWLGGLAACMRRGLAALAGLAAMTVPFTGLWLIGWWAGWDNSFNKGYEQAHVGPMVGMAGAALCPVVMLYLPLALAHQAVEDRAFAMFEMRRVQSVLSHAGWGHVLFALASVILSLPIFAGRGLVVFAEGIWPGVADLTPEALGRLELWVGLGKAAYVFGLLLLLRRWSAVIYANAASAAARAQPGLWAGSVMAATLAPHAGPVARRSVAVLRWVRAGAVVVVGAGLVVQIFVGQFLNHDWHMWLTHPLFGLPWAG